MYSNLKFSGVSRTALLIQVFYNKYREKIVKEIVNDFEKAKIIPG